MKSADADLTRRAAADKVPAAVTQRDGHQQAPRPRADHARVVGVVAGRAARMPDRPTTGAVRDRVADARVGVVVLERDPPADPDAFAARAPRARALRARGVAL